MEENKTQQTHSHEHCCHACGVCTSGGHYHRHFLLRWLLGLLILVAVFAVGVKVGEFKQMLRSEFFPYSQHDTMMRRHGMMGENQPILFKAQPQMVAPVTAVPTATTTTPVTKKK